MFNYKSIPSILLQLILSAKYTNDLLTLLFIYRYLISEVLYEDLNSYYRTKEINFFDNLSSQNNKVLFIQSKSLFEKNLSHAHLLISYAL
jgi:hypothetical protein